MVQCFLLSCQSEMMPQIVSVQQRSFEEPVSGEEQLAADRNREWFEQHRVLAVNVIAAPGAGKTTLLTRLVPLLVPRLMPAVIVGESAGGLGGEPFRRLGVPVVEVTTGRCCHLSASQVSRAVASMDLSAVSVLFIENVGGLICPVEYDLGQQLNMLLVSVPEGEQVPLKYPFAVHAADAVVITKMDLMPLLPRFRLHDLKRYLRQISEGVLICESGAAGAGGERRVGQWLVARHAQVFDAAISRGEDSRSCP